MSQRRDTVQYRQYGMLCTAYGRLLMSRCSGRMQQVGMRACDVQQLYDMPASLLSGVRDLKCVDVAADKTAHGKFFRLGCGVIYAYSRII